VWCLQAYVGGGSQVWSCKDGEVPTTTAHRKHFLTSIRAIFAPGKGILATDESTASIVYFDSIGVENTLENRRNYRELLITTPQLEDHISGIILYEETLFQNARNGTPFVELLQAKGILAGVKVGILSSFEIVMIV
jgi:fructose-bisphosphate aldolase, class I